MGILELFQRDTILKFADNNKFMEYLKLLNAVLCKFDKVSKINEHFVNSKGLTSTDVA